MANLPAFLGGETSVFPAAEGLKMPPTPPKGWTWKCGADSTRLQRVREVIQYVDAANVLATVKVPAAIKPQMLCGELIDIYEPSPGAIGVRANVNIPKDKQIALLDYTFNFSSHKVLHHAKKLLPHVFRAVDSASLRKVANSVRPRYEEKVPGFRASLRVLLDEAEILLAFGLFAEMMRPQGEGPFEFYVRSIPSPKVVFESVPTVLSVQDFERLSALMRGTTALDDIMINRLYVAAGVDTLLEACVPAPQLQQVYERSLAALLFGNELTGPRDVARWAFGCVVSRAFDAEVDGKLGAGLMVIEDLLSGTYGDAPNVFANRCQQYPLPGFYQYVRAAKNLAAGEELLVAYSGPQRNASDMFVRYGFVPADTDPRLPARYFSLGFNCFLRDGPHKVTALQRRALYEVYKDDTTDENETIFNDMTPESTRWLAAYSEEDHLFRNSFYMLMMRKPEHEELLNNAIRYDRLRTQGWSDEQYADTLVQWGVMRYRDLLAKAPPPSSVATPSSLQETKSDGAAEPASHTPTRWVDAQGPAAAILLKQELQALTYWLTVQVAHTYHAEKRLRVKMLPERLCDGCGSTFDTKACSHCRQVYYCSKECQRERWPAHKKEVLPAASTPPAAAEPSNTTNNNNDSTASA